jgi:Ca2+-binding EF-hand superfamily protein
MRRLALALLLTIAVRTGAVPTNETSLAFTSVDRDRTGQITLEEYLNYRLRSIEIRFRALDRDRDELISSAEFDAAMQPSSAQRRLYQQQTGEEIDPPPAFDDIDADDDQRISLPEFRKAQQDAMRQRFKVLDVDADGVLSPTEFETARQRFLRALREGPSPAKAAP